VAREGAPAQGQRVPGPEARRAVAWRAVARRGWKHPRSRVRQSSGEPKNHRTQAPARLARWPASVQEQPKNATLGHVICEIPQAVNAEARAAPWAPQTNNEERVYTCSNEKTVPGLTQLGRARFSIVTCETAVYLDCWSDFR
jgi:hypothetical protein